MIIPKAVKRAIALGAVYFRDPAPDQPIHAPCESPLYCHGDILHQIQTAGPFADSKTFVDM